MQDKILLRGQSLAEGAGFTPINRRAFRRISRGFSPNRVFEIGISTSSEFSSADPVKTTYARPPAVESRHEVSSEIHLSKKKG